MRKHELTNKKTKTKTMTITFRPNFTISAKFHNPGIPGILGIPGVRVVSQFLRCFYVHLDFSLWNSNCTDSIHFLYPFWFVIIFTLFATFWTMLKKMHNWKTMTSLIWSSMLNLQKYPPLFSGLLPPCWDTHELTWISWVGTIEIQSGHFELGT